MMGFLETRRLLSVREAAAELGVGLTLMRELVASGKVTSVQINTRRLIPNDAIDAFIERLKED
jgi:excisionase family DNA binding protein